MKTSFTPGPWKVLAQNTNRPSDLFSVISEREDERKESIVCNSCDREDARLIAAAPELLAFVVDVNVWLMSPDTSHEILEIMQRRTIAALTKAKGQA